LLTGHYLNLHAAAKPVRRAHRASEVITIWHFINQIIIIIVVVVTTVDYSYFSQAFLTARINLMW